MKIPTALFFAVVSNAAAQSPEVPHKMEFAGITLIIREDARREIQKDVDAYTQSPRHYNIKVERAKTYFPIIEKVFREEQVPEDFKYLVLQESALIPDAVSTSNAVGFWQFKDFTAIEMGLRVDKQIDERMNIVSSSRAAARYLKKNNGFFNNWIYALQAYQMGAGGVMKAEKDTRGGATRMDITSDTYWYVKKFLAHKIAYEPAVAGKGQIEVVAYENSSGKSLKQLAKEISIDEEVLAGYNKWARSGSIPADRTYAVIVPLNDGGEVSLPVVASRDDNRDLRDRKPAITKKINGVLALQARAGENAAALASRADVDLNKFLKWNDLRTRSSESLVAGQYYFLSRKRLRAIEDFHKIAPGEDLWIVSQQYGLQLRRLKRYNRLRSGEGVPAGTMLYLASRRPRSRPLTSPVVDPVIVDNEESFNWNPAAGDDRGAPATETVVAPGDSLEMAETQAAKPADSLKTLQATGYPPTVIADTSQTIVEIPPAPGEHTVKAGQTLYGIARDYNVTVMDLVNWNDLDLQLGIKPGQVLKLSGNQTISPADGDAVPVTVTPVTTHEVKASDTLYSIARHYGVTIKELMDWNGKKDFSLSVGEKLEIHQRH